MTRAREASHAGSMFCDIVNATADAHSPAGTAVRFGDSDVAIRLIVHPLLVICARARDVSHVGSMFRRQIHTAGTHTHAGTAVCFGIQTSASVFIAERLVMLAYT